MNSIVKFSLVVLLLLQVMAFAGCNTTDQVSKSGNVVIEVGISSEALIDLIGMPDSVQPYGSGSVGSEAWVYRNERFGTEMVSTGLEEQLYIDPISGEERKTFSNIMSPEITVSEKRTIFLVIDGVVRAWRVEEEEKSYL